MFGSSFRLHTAGDSIAQTVARWFVKLKASISIPGGDESFSRSKTQQSLHRCLVPLKHIDILKFTRGERLRCIRLWCALFVEYRNATIYPSCAATAQLVCVDAVSAFLRRKYARVSFFRRRRMRMR